MEIKLNVYKGKTVEKTYTAESYDLMFGTMEDIVNLIDLDKLTKNGSDADFVMAVAKVVAGGFGQFKPLLKDIFEGITDDELRRVKVSEVVPVIIDVVKLTFAEIFEPGKNR